LREEVEIQLETKRCSFWLNFAGQKAIGARYRCQRRPYQRGMKQIELAFEHELLAWRGRCTGEKTAFLGAAGSDTYLRGLETYLTRGHFKGSFHSPLYLTTPCANRASSAFANHYPSIDQRKAMNALLIVILAVLYLSVSAFRAPVVFKRNGLAVSVKMR
jgi:hypothetical protein